MKKSILLGLNLIITVVFYSQNKNISFSNYYNLSKDFPSLKHSSIQPFLESHLIISDTVEKSNRSKIGKKIIKGSSKRVCKNGCNGQYTDNRQQNSQSVAGNYFHNWSHVLITLILK